MVEEGELPIEPMTLAKKRQLFPVKFESNEPDTCIVGTQNLGVDRLVAR